MLTLLNPRHGNNFQNGRTLASISFQNGRTNIHFKFNQGQGDNKYILNARITWICLKLRTFKINIART